MRSIPIAALAALVVALSGCATQPGTTADGIRIVASTDVYGDVAQAIAGDRAEVTSIISGTVQDPHSYEATARDQLAVANADIVIENGGGYDSFIDGMLAASGGSDTVVITVSDLAADHDGEAESHDDAESGDVDSHDDHGHIEGFNEHVWYDLHVMEAFAGELAQSLGTLDPDGAAQYNAQLASFTEQLDQLIQRAEGLRHEFEGKKAFATEPVPDYLLQELGFENVTPEDYVSAVEGGVDVAPSVLLEALRLIESGQVALLVHNEQTTGPEIEQAVTAAREHDVPVVPMTETLPAGMHYLDWMRSNIDAIVAALGAGTQ
ncbi:zinc ABC transporter substrate-binding protein [Leifsonia bigeumensis]|uniref:Zinc ABC transporter substrate-binding protein n=1 Tax=Leifsonella bigeumensis TaxID=433643 RepID=A0ABP7F4Z3_9MICO